MSPEINELQMTNVLNGFHNGGYLLRKNAHVQNSYFTPDILSFKIIHSGELTWSFLDV